MQTGCAGWGSPCTPGNLDVVPTLHARLPSPPLPFPGSGRTSFYEEYGVIRDVLQNHLTEVLTLVAMELPHNASSAEAVLRHKLQALGALRGLRGASAVLGQYRAYSAQVRRELRKPDGFHSLTPTFAGGPRPRPPPEAASTPRRPWVWVGRDLTGDVRRGTQWQATRSPASPALHQLRAAGRPLALSR